MELLYSKERSDAIEKAFINREIEKELKVWQSSEPHKSDRLTSLFRIAQKAGKGFVVRISTHGEGVAAVGHEVERFYSKVKGDEIIVTLPNSEERKRRRHHVIKMIADDTVLYMSSAGYGAGSFPRERVISVKVI